MQREKRTELPNNGQVVIQFTPKSVTPWGGTASIIARFINKIGLQQFIKETFPFEETSNNSTGIYAKIISTFITILNNGSKFSHMQYWADSIDLFQRCFNVARLPKSTSSLTRFWNNFNTYQFSEKMRDYFVKIALNIVHQSNVKSDSLRFDSTVMTRYGKQEGAMRGYNPRKKGRPSHQPQIAFLGCGYTVNLWNRSGNISSGNGIIEFFKQTVSYLGDISVERILADSGYYAINLLNYLEDHGYEYVISAPVYGVLQKKIYGITDWCKVSDGIETAEFYFQHQDEKWEKERRYVVVRQEITKRPKAAGKQLTIFEELDGNVTHRHSLMITNNEDDDPHTIWNFYKPRANDENIISNLKEGFGFSAYNMNNFWATEVIMSAICLLYHNLITYLMLNIIQSKHPRQTLRTTRMKYLIIPAIMGKSGRKDVLRLGVNDKSRQQLILQILEKIRITTLFFNCNAFEL